MSSQQQRLSNIEKELGKKKGGVILLVSNPEGVYPDQYYKDGEKISEDTYNQLVKAGAKVYRFTCDWNGTRPLKFTGYNEGNHDTNNQA